MDSTSVKEEMREDSVAAEVIVVAGNEQETVSSLICSGLEAVNGTFTDRADAYNHNELQFDSTICSEVSSCNNSYPPLLDNTTVTPKMVNSVPMLQKNSNNNNCNIGGGVSLKATDDLHETPRKKFRASTATACHKGIEVTLEGKPLWDEFCRRGTEMIVNRAGRRMFPGFSVAIGSLKPKAKYSMKLEVVLADNHRFKFLNSRWLAVGSAEPQPLSESYLHPDSPNSGAFWMRHGVSFRKLKITNNKERPGNNALLYSMHKYFLRLIVEEERKGPPGDEKLLPKVVLQIDFPETTFVAVTAYQNEEVTQLKITNNPFAKAFRENAADMDWETAQMLYNNQNAFPPLPHQQTDHHHLGSNMMGNSGGSWPFPNPLFPPTPLTASLPPPLSPLSGFITPNSSATSAAGYLTPGQFPYNSPASPHYFHWPAPQSQHSSPSNRVQDISFSNPYHQMYQKIGLEHSAYSSPTTGANLPDFETVFTTLSN